MKIVENTKELLIDSIKEELDDITHGGEGKEIYFHDLVHEEVDTAIVGLSRRERFEIINETENTQYVNWGVINTENWSILLSTLSFECLRIELFEDDIIQYLQDELNNEVISPEKAKEIKENL